MNQKAQNPSENYFMEIEKINNEAKNLKEKELASSHHGQQNSKSLAKSKSKEKKSIADLSNLVNQIANRRYFYHDFFY